MGGRKPFIFLLLHDSGTEGGDTIPAAEPWGPGAGNAMGRRWLGRAWKRGRDVQFLVPAALLPVTCQGALPGGDAGRLGVAVAAAHSPGGEVLGTLSFPGGNQFWNRDRDIASLSQSRL